MTPAAPASPLSCSKGEKYVVTPYTDCTSPPFPLGPTKQGSEWAWEGEFRAYPSPDRARGHAKREHLRAELNRDPADRARSMALDGQGVGEIAAELKAGVRQVNAWLEDLDTEIPTDRRPDPRAAEVHELTDGRLAMVGSQPPGRDGHGSKCWRHHYQRCVDCDQRKAEGHTVHVSAQHGAVPWPEPYVRTGDPKPCESPACRSCKTVYVPTRAAAAAIRLQALIEQLEAEGHQVTVRHVTVSPPHDQLPTDRDQARAWDQQAQELLLRKGAVGAAVVRHPWRGTPGRWRPGYHVHAVAVFTEDHVDDRALPEAWEHEFVPGGRNCCHHHGPNADLQAPCCDGTCGTWACAATRAARARRSVQAARREVQRAAGRYGALKRDRTRVSTSRLHQARAHLDQAQAVLDREKAWAAHERCDQAWVVHVIQDQDDQPRELPDDTWELRGGKHQGREVRASLLALLTYELDHAGVVLDQEGKTRMHTLKWCGRASYNQLNLAEEDAELVKAYKKGTEPQSCPVCKGDHLVPLSANERRQAERIWSDPDLKRELQRHREAARKALRDHADEGDDSPGLPEEEPTPGLPPPEDEEAYGLWQPEEAGNL